MTLGKNRACKACLTIHTVETVRLLKPVTEKVQSLVLFAAHCFLKGMMFLLSLVLVLAFGCYPVLRHWWWWSLVPVQ